MMSPYGNAPDTDWPFTSPLNTKPSVKALNDAVAYSLLNISQYLKTQLRIQPITLKS
jgi:hypothetical protein